MDQSEERFERGFTFRSALAILFASAILMPATIYLSLASGVYFAAAGIYITAILFTEIAALAGKPLKTQELFIIYSVAGLAVSAPSLMYVFQSYFVTTPLTRAFIDPATYLPLPDVIPSWWAPPINSPVHIGRTLFHADWILPVLIPTVQYGVFFMFQEIAMALFFSILYIETENLRFPMADVDAQMVITLTERSPDRMKVFTLGVFAGFAYAVPLYVLPIIAFGAFNIQMTIIPVPWVDLTTGFFGIEKILPGAILGIMTDLSPFVTGFLVPLNVVASMLIGSIGVWVFGNYLTRTLLRENFLEWAAEWRPNMGLSLVWQRSYIRVWIGPLIGFMVVGALIAIVQGRRSIIRAFRSLSRLSPSLSREKGYPSITMILAIFFGGTGASVILFHLLVPDFPIWIPILISMGGGFLNAIVSVRAIAETGSAVMVPLLWQGSILLSGYQGINPWFISPTGTGIGSTPLAVSLGGFGGAAGGGGAPGYVQSVKVAYLTKTRPSDYFKAYVFAVAAYLTLSYVYVQFFWSIAPIPSSVYLFSTTAWPLNVMTFGMWATRQVTAFKPDIMLNSFILMLAVGAASQILVRFTPIPFSFFGFLAGCNTIPPPAISIFLGGIFGRYVFQRYFGNVWWKNYRAVVAASLLAGEGLAVGLATAVVMIARAAWMLPY